MDERLEENPLALISLGVNGRESSCLGRSAKSHGS